MSSVSATVQVLKRSLSKHLQSSSSSSESGGDKDGTTTAADEAMGDVLDRLDECEMTIDVLTQTLVGTVVSKLKGHATLGNKARALIKKWKAVAKKASEEEGVGESMPSSSSAAAKQPPKAKGGLSSSSAAGAATSQQQLKPPAPVKRSSSSLLNKPKPNPGASQPASPPPPPPPSRLDRRQSAASVGSTAASCNTNDNDGDDMDNDDPSVYWSDLPEHRRNVCQKLNSVLLLAKPQLLGAHSSGEQETDEGGGGGAAAIHADAILHLVGQRAAEIEEAVYAAFPANAKAYADKARSLSFNLKKNPGLSASVVLGGASSGISPADLVGMTSEQLASDAVRTARAREAQRVIDSKRLDWEQANEDKINEMCGIKGDLLKASLFTCSRCKSTKTTSTQKQTRSADEPMTVFVLCINCGKRWKC